MEKDLFSFLKKEFSVLGAPQEALWVFKELENIEISQAFKTAQEIVDRRKKHEPLAYILGHWDFRNLKLYVGPGVLIPRPETEELVDHVLNYFRKHPSRSFEVADLGAGSGAIGLSLLSESLQVSQLYLVESSQEALLYLKKNSKSVSQNSNSKPIVFERDWNFFNEKVDVIVSNPPYISDTEFESLEKGVREYEPFEALISSGNATKKYIEIFQKAEELLKPGGAIFLEFGPAQEEKWSGLVPPRYEWKIIEDQARKKRFLLAFDTGR
jgi:release factor glutamine methyltransferase